MVNQVNGIIRSLLRQRIQHQYRSLHITASNSLDASSSTPRRAKGVKGVKTKRAYEDLPKHRLNADGMVAAPLENWWGGEPGSEISLGNTSLYTNAERTERDEKPRDADSVEDNSMVLTRDSGDSGDVGNVEIDSSQASLIKEKPKRRRKIKADVEVERVPTSEDAPAKKRGRKKAAIKTKDETVNPDIVEGEEPDNGRQGTLATEIMENHSKFPHCILLTRVGQFYESYFDQAIEVASLLNIKLAKRKWAGKSVPMCGFPLAHLDKYLKTLVQQNRRFVAMCEEFPKYHSAGKREFERRVVRVITPGTLIDESFLNHYENNYLLAISPPSASEVGRDGTHSAGIAWIDVSTGEFYSKEVPMENLRDDLARIGPKEVLLDHTYRSDTTGPALNAIAEIDAILSFVNTSSSAPSFIDKGLPTEASGVADEIVLDDDNGSGTSNVYTPAETLEIRENMREGGTKGSLMSVIKRTVTNGGTRLLSRWLCSPSASVKEIDARQSLVAFFCDRPHFRSDLRMFLSRAEDAGRIVQKFLLGRGDPSDLLSLSTGIQTWASVAEKVRLEHAMEASETVAFDRSHEWASINALLSRMADLGGLAGRIRTAIVQSEGQPVAREPISDDGLMSDIESPVLSFNRHDWRYGRSRFGININPQFSEELQNAHSTLQNLLNRKEKLEERLQLKYDAPSLTLRSSPAQGMHVHLAKSKRDQTKLKADPAFTPISETGTTKCYFNQEWSQLGSQIFESALALSLAEKEAFETLRQEITSHASSLRRNARILDELDVTLAFASLATELNFVRPMITEDTSYHVVNGRHPTVEMGLLTSGKVFTANTVHLDPKSNLHVITGPNMAGKSTFLRQTALIAILAQTGSYVPADSATIGIVDRLFSRVGATDDLFHDRSTFMVEMLETAEILRRATPKSLVIMDEVGRGTTVNDGVAIAFAAIHHMVSVNQCRALFATHFHELSDMLGCTDTHKGQGRFENVSFYCTDVDELEEGYFTYSYRLNPGVNRDSHGLKVAQLAGMPEAAISVALNVLTALHEQKARKYDAEQLASLGQSVSQD
ncbi:hypothetical protein PM082_003006 [Marasmius tenuissimus]|nr:hypothetical protein PM082_003006 [Marasmius tenuissimus]